MEKELIEKSFVKELKRLIALFNKTTQKDVLFGCKWEEDYKNSDNPRADFFFRTGLKGALRSQSVDPNNDKPTEEVHTMSVGNTVTIPCSYEFPREKFESQLGELLANYFVRDMLDAGIASLYGALMSVKNDSVIDCTSSIFKRDHLYECRDFTFPPQTWIAHSSPYFDLRKDCDITAPIKPTFSFEKGGFVDKIQMKNFIVRDHNALWRGGDGKINKYSTIGLYGGGLAIFLDNFKVDLPPDNVCWLSCDQSIAIKGFTWQGENDSSYNKLPIPENWQAKSKKDKQQWAGFIVETGVTKTADDVMKVLDRLAADRKADNEAARKRQKATDKQLQELGKQIGSVHKQWGEVAEYLVASDFINIVKEYFGIKISLERTVRNMPVTYGKKNWEIDTFVTNKEITLVGEVKLTISKREIKKFAKNLSEFHLFLPEHSNKKVYGVIAFVKVARKVNEEELVKQAHDLGLLVVKAIDDTFRLMTPREHKLKNYGKVKS